MEQYEREQIETEKNIASQNIFYSDQRLDLLIIAVSGAGVYVCLETIKFSLEHEPEMSTTLLKWAGLSFVVAVIVNIISQVTSKKANHYDYLMSCCKLEGDRKGTAKYDCYSSSWDKATTYLNNSSIAFMACGLIVVLIFFFTST